MVHVNVAIVIGVTCKDFKCKCKTISNLIQKIPKLSIFTGLVITLRVFTLSNHVSLSMQYFVFFFN